MVQSRVRIREINKRFYRRCYFGIWFFGGWLVLTWPNKKAIQGETTAAAHIDHFVDTVPVFVLFLLACLWCLVRSAWLAPRLGQAVKHERAAYHPLIWVPFLGLFAVFVTALLVIFAVLDPLAFTIFAIVVVTGLLFISWKGRRAMRRA